MPHGAVKLDVVQYHVDYWTYNVKLTKPQGSKTDQIIQDIINELSQNPKQKPTREDILTMVIRATKGKIFDRHAFPIAQAVYFHFHEEICTQLFVHRLNKQFFPSS